MSVINSIPLIAAGDDGYQISRSVRLRSAASAYFDRTFSAAPTVRTKQTFSAWVKRGSISSSQGILSGYDGSSASRSVLYFNSSDQLAYDNGGSAAVLLASTAVYRDPSAWYHIVLSIDTTQATSSNRVLLYVNGTQLTSFSSANYPSLNATTQLALNNTNNFIGRLAASNWHFDGYLTEINFIDGQALTPSSFGETDSITGVWKPKKYAGTYGTNGFYLNFSDNSAATATTIGRDYSGNGNNWTPNNISVTAGATYDSMLDVPTLYADGGNGRGNYCVINPLDNGGTTVSNANLTASTAANADYIVRSTVGMTSGKWYWEVQVGFQSTGTARGQIGIASFASALNTFLGGTATSYGYFSDNGNKYNNASAAAYGATYTTNDIIGVAFDADAGTLTFYKNNVSQGTAFTGLTSGPYFPATTPTWGFISNFNFGQRPFAYTPPTGFRALNTQNLPEPTIKKGNQYFDAKLFTANDAANTITGLGFQPDLVWTKRRDQAYNHDIYDSVRGIEKRLQSNNTNAENTDPNTLTAFNSDGFTLGTNDNANNAPSGGSALAWVWKESPSAGFDIVTFNTQASGVGTISHSLGVAPSMIIVKYRNGTSGWATYHSAVGNTKYLTLNTTNAATVDSTYWNNTSPSSTVFTLGTAFVGSLPHVAYLFAEVAGFSRFGSYTGNGSADGPFVFTGFRPRWVMVKCSSSGGDWLVFDTARNTFNVMNALLYPDLSNAEETTSVVADVLANGFKVRNSFGNLNTSGQTYIFAAFAENPFKNSLAR